ncbi:MAG: hypothetical protein JWM64_225 [Frankiales bacterium]|nr:hypothetical protein [Frankiales bacterium]
MVTPGTAAAAGEEPVAPEVLSWDPPETLTGESRPPVGVQKGFLLRLHADPRCPVRLVPGGRTVARSYDQARVADLCPACTGEVVARSSSTVLARLRDAERTLRRLLVTAHTAPVPREIVHCRALRFEAEQAVSAHPAVAPLAAEVAVLAGEVAEALREGLRTALRPR